MRRHRSLTSLVLGLCALAGAAIAGPSKGSKAVTSFHQLNARSLEGKDVSLADFKGKVALVVNTASECGYTPQYEGLEALWDKYKDKGLVVLGFPSNDFGGQEPGSAKEIATFCKMRYGVSFPLFEKQVVKGKDAGPVFRYLTEQKGEPKWNFHKYLVGKDGKVIAAYESKVAPDDKQLIAAIDAALAAK